MWTRDCRPWYFCWDVSPDLQPVRVGQRGSPFMWDPFPGAGQGRLTTRSCELAAGAVTAGAARPQYHEWCTRSGRSRDGRAAATAATSVMAHVSIRAPRPREPTPSLSLFLIFAVAAKWLATAYQKRLMALRPGQISVQKTRHRIAWLGLVGVSSGSSTAP